jgi:CRP/FNR family transcriptional regulator, anaerobic regulatory protein
MSKNITFALSNKTSDREAGDDSIYQQLFRTKPVHYAAKDIIYNEGTVVDAVFVINKGMVKLVSHLPNGRARIVRVHSTGSWLGLCGVLGQPFQHTAVAVDDVEAYCIPIGKLIHIKAHHPHIFNQLLEHWFDYLQEADMWIAEFSTGVVKARVARLVNYLSDIEGKDTSNEVKLLTCEEMADILGATPESVSRVLAEFKRKKVLYPITFPVNDCYHRNVSALNTIAQG